MNDKDLKDLINRCANASYLLGKVTGGLIVIEDDLKNGLIEESTANVTKLLSFLNESIEKLYYVDVSKIKDGVTGNE